MSGAAGAGRVRLFPGWRRDDAAGGGPDPAPPALIDPAISSALDCVALAEARCGPIPRPVRSARPWGDLAGALARRRRYLRIGNLETAVPARGRPEPKGIDHRMSPAMSRC